MPIPNQTALSFLRTRRSRPAKTLAAPVPSRDELEPLLEAALRVPDHGKLEPFRLIVLERDALDRLDTLAESRGVSLGLPPEQIDKGRAQFRDGHLAVAVVFSPQQSDKIPRIEQQHASACVCLQLLNAALAAGWGANWLTGWPSHDRRFVEEGLGLASDEEITGLVHIATETSPPPERPRPDVAARTTWMSQ